MKIKLRIGKRKDIGEIIKLSEELADFHYRLDSSYYKPGKDIKSIYFNWLKKIILKKTHKIIVFEDKNGLAGYFIADIQKSNPVFVPKLTGHISDGYIKAEYRKKGLGKMAIKELKKWFIDNRVKHIELTVDTNNLIGIKAWQGLGFKEVRKKMRMTISDKTSN